MTTPLEIRVYDQNRLVFTEEFEGAVELGRQSDGREGLFSTKLDAGRWRVVIARFDEGAISRKVVLLEPLADGKVRLTNLSTINPLRLADGAELLPKASSEQSIPLVLMVGKRAIRIQRPAVEELALHGLAEATMAPGQFAASPRLPTLELPSVGGVEVESLIRWLQTIIGVLQTAASSADFFQQAARAVVETVGLDFGRVLILEAGSWRVETLTAAPHCVAEPDWQPSRQVLKRLRDQKRTFWQEPDQSGLTGGSLIGVSAVVAAPILNRQGEVIGALYGERRQGSTPAAAPRIMKLDAMLMEILASGIATGLARIEQEKAALAARVQFEQFFTPELASELAARPDLLKGRDVEVTLLFCDIRGFSRISERLGPAGTVEWIGNVMGVLSDCVLAHQGVLVDYIGDELIAMWGAPKEAADHARLACRAALDMLDRLPDLNAHWLPTLGESMGLGIGVNTGIAQVGNTGSNRKFKYGALGNTVNLASRVQGATKYLKTKLVITGSTQAQLDSSFMTRRLCRVEVVNIAEPVDLYELDSPGQLDWFNFRREYEKALAQFENKNFRDTTRILGNLLIDHPDDGPSLILLSRAVNCLVEDLAHFNPVWKLPGK